DGSVLHLRGGVALGVDVGDLLELERALERDREAHAAAQVEETAPPGVRLGDGAYARLERQRAGDVARQPRQLARDLLPHLERQAPLAPEPQGEQRPRTDPQRERRG